MSLGFHSAGAIRGAMPFGAHLSGPSSHADNVVFKRDGAEPYHFDETKLGSVQPTLGEPQGFNINATDLEDIFGISANRLGKLPARMVIPVLGGRHYVENWYEVYGYLYVVEPEEWIPEVLRLGTMPASAFITQHETKTEKISETKFNAGTSAEITMEGGGSYYGVTAGIKSTSELSFSYAQSTTTTETLKTTGTTGNQVIYHLAVYPLLRCKVVRKLRIAYTINDSSEELKWSPDSYNKGYWSEHYVNGNRLREVEKASLHPVPMTGNGLGGKAYMLPIPQLTENEDDIDVTVVMSRTGWKDWYRYDAYDWEENTSDDRITVAAPNNNVAFGPLNTWTTLPAMKPQPQSKPASKA